MKCRVRLVRSRTPGSHPGNMGSNPILGANIYFRVGIMLLSFSLV